MKRRADEIQRLWPRQNLHVSGVDAKGGACLAHGRVALLTLKGDALVLRGEEEAVADAFGERVSVEVA